MSTTPAAPASFCRDPPIATKILNASAPFLAAPAPTHFAGGPKSQLQPDPAGVVDSVQENRDAILHEILIARLPGPSPVSVVVNDDHTGLGYAGEEVNQFVPGRGIPVGIESQQRDRFRRRSRYGFLHLTSNEMDFPPGIASPVEHLFHLLQWCVRAPVRRVRKQ